MNFGEIDFGDDSQFKAPPKTSKNPKKEFSEKEKCLEEKDNFEICKLKYGFNDARCKRNQSILTYLDHYLTKLDNCIKK